MAGAEYASSYCEEVFVTATAVAPSLELGNYSMRKLENKKLDEVGKALIKAGSVSTRDLEKIVANPALFDSIRTRIAFEGSAPVPRRSFLRPGVATFASVALMTAVALSFGIFNSGPDEVVVDQHTVVPPKPVLKPHQEPDTIADISARQTSEPTSAQGITNRTSIRTSRPKQPVVQQARYSGEFYAVSYAGDPHETERGGRIVRVDIPRSTLFAMGVDIPLENERETVKADLLIGNDGVTRGIRVVE
ncbi:MAG TPA: hypothetical protein VLA17_06765 [Candidatus Limnocylindria bacterium]|nr:hypothetical protein [Candidatus Limnocylindria bacterium]